MNDADQDGDQNYFKYWMAQDHLGLTLADHRCSLGERPEDRRRCGEQRCRHTRRRRFLWKVRVEVVWR